MAWISVAPGGSEEQGRQARRAGEEKGRASGSSVCPNAVGQAAGAGAQRLWASVNSCAVLMPETFSLRRVRAVASFHGGLRSAVLQGPSCPPSP